MMRYLFTGPYRWYAILILATTVFTAIPYVVGILAAPDGATFAGSHILTPGDFSVYFSYLEQVRQGTGLIRDLYTTEPNLWPFLTPVWATAGMIGTIFHLPPAYTLHLVRLLLIPPLLTLLVVLIRSFFSDERHRRWAFLAAVFTSGLGSTILPVLAGTTFNPAPGYYHYPMDLWVPEAFTFLTIYHNPLFIVALAGLVAAFAFFLRAIDAGHERSRYALWAGAGAFVAILVHPFQAFTIVGVIVVYSTLRHVLGNPFSKPQWKVLLHFGVLAAPAVAYHALALYLDPGAAGRAAQNLNITTVWWLTLVSYGLLGILAAVGVIRLLPSVHRNHSRLFLVCWFVVQGMLIYAPLAYQRRLTEGLHLPVAILAVFGGSALLVFLRRRGPRVLALLWGPGRVFSVAVLLVLFCLSNAVVIFYDLQRYLGATSDVLPPYHYHHQSDREAYKWVRNNTAPSAIILADPASSLFLPGQTARRVYIGHSVETLNAQWKLQQVGFLFRSDATPTAWRTFLRSEGITHIWWGPRERDQASFDPGSATFLTNVFENDAVTLFAVHMR